MEEVICRFARRIVADSFEAIEFNEPWWDLGGLFLSLFMIVAQYKCSNKAFPKMDDSILWCSTNAHKDQSTRLHE